MKFVTTLLRGDSKNVVGIVIPPEVVESFGAGKKPPVAVTLNGYTYRSTVAVMGGRFMVGVASEHREKAGVTGGETLEVEIVLDTAPRTIEVPPDLTRALTDAGALTAFEALAPSHRKEHVRSVGEAKAEDTRRRRIAAVVAKTLAAKR